MSDASDSLTASEVRRVCGDLPDATVEAILGTGASFSELEAAAAADESEAPMSPAAAAIRQILDEDAGWDDEED
jgi:hypothetical protein